jgi:cysteine desulfurase/selenocysteine lyase
LLERMPPFMGGGQMIDTVTLETATYAPPPRRFEAGTPPIAGAIGLGAAATWLSSLDWSAVTHHERALTKRLIDGLNAIGGIRILGPQDTADRRGVVSFTLDGDGLEDLCRRLDEHGVAVRYGQHCAQPLLTALGARSAGRASLGLYNTEADIDALLEGVERVLR